MSIFSLSTGKKAESTGSAELGGSSEPIPEGTKVRAIITEAKWDEYQGERFIKLRWDVVSGEFAKRVIFHKVKVYEPDPKKADKHRLMLAAIDFNCGGKLSKIDGEPSEIDLIKCLSNKPMVIRLGVWTIDGKSGNWLQAVESGKPAPAEKSEPKPESKPAPKPAPEPEVAPIDEDIIPF
jgi:hypothetical protein